MDRKTMVILGVCMALLFAWPHLVRKAFPPPPVQPGATNVVAAPPTVPVAPNTSAPAATAASPASVVAAPAIAQPVFDTNAPEQLVVLTNDDARYTFTSRGGGLKQVELRRYPESVSALRKKRRDTNDVVTLNETAPLPVGVLLDSGAVQGDGIYQLTQTVNWVRAEKTLAGGLSVVKEFLLSTNYLVNATVRLENRGAQPLVLPARELVVGTATPLGPQDKGQFVGLMWYDGAKADESANQAWFANRKFGCGPGSPRSEYRAGQSNVVWASAHNQFFTFAAMPASPAQQIVVRPVTLPRFEGAGSQDANAQAEPPPQGYQASFEYPAVTLAPGQAVEQKINLFAGPKEYRTLASIADRFDNNVDLVMGYSGFFGGFARALLLAMNWLHDFIRLPYGWAIVAITVIIKTLFWPLTQASTRSMKRMQALQPQMAAIKEKYKDDAVKMNRKTMEFMKENKVNPMGGCLPMVIQLPIFIGFYRMIQSAIELRGAPFLWIGDLSQSDTLFIIPGLGFIPFIAIPGVGLPFNLLPLIMGATQIWQMSLTPPSPGMDPAQQKMMKYMPLMFLVILYNFSAGLTLYWTVQNLLTIVQTKLTKNQPLAVAVTAPVKKGK